VYGAGFGVRQVGNTDAVDADTVFQLASLSKSLGATVVAHQMGSGVISWDTPIVNNLPWFVLDDGWVTSHVTIADMFAHRSGLPDHAGDDLEDLGYDRAQVLQRLRFLKLNSFRDEFAYTNFGPTAAAEAVAAESHADWATLSEQALYAPLGMTRTSSRFSDFIDRPNHAVNHVRIGGAFEAKYQRQPDAQSPAGGVSSSANDMARWMALVLNGGVYDGSRIIPERALRLAMIAEVVVSSSRAIDAKATLYGYGFGVGVLPSGRVVISHSGMFAMGAATHFLLIPSLNLGIVALSNAEPIGAVEALDFEFADLVQFGVITRDWLSTYGDAMPAPAFVGSLVGEPPPQHPAPARQPETYTGTYYNDYFGDAGVTQHDDTLILSLGPKKAEYPLRHWDGDVFTYAPSGENAPARAISKVTFTTDAAGRATSLDIEFYRQSGWSRFARR
jgi:CubicO group peptidase (beta-lactamase class C family)